MTGGRGTYVVTTIYTHSKGVTIRTYVPEGEASQPAADKLRRRLRAALKKSRPELAHDVVFNVGLLRTVDADKTMPEVIR